MQPVHIVGGGLAGVLAAFEAHRQGADEIVLHERSSSLGGSARGRIRHRVELRERPILFGPPSDPITSLLEEYGLSFLAFADPMRGALHCLPTGGFPLFFDACHTRLRALGVTVKTGDLVAPQEAMALTQGGLVVWAAAPAPLFKPLGLGRPALQPETSAAYSFCAYWDGPLPYRMDYAAAGPLRGVYLYETGQGAALTAECAGEMDDTTLRLQIDALMAGAGGFLKVAGLLGETINTRWALRDSEAAGAMAALHRALGRRAGGRFLIADWPGPEAIDFLEFRAAIERELGSEDLRVRATG